MDWCRRVFTKITKVEIKDDVWNGFVQFVKFGLVGLSNTVISYATYYILVPFHVNKYVASVIGFILSVANAFYWNNSYVFKKEDQEQRSPLQAFIKLFLSYAGTGLVLHKADDPEHRTGAPQQVLQRELPHGAGIHQGREPHHRPVSRAEPERSRGCFVQTR